MGMPLLAIGASADKLLPKAGAWMDSVKSVFGVILLATAIWMLERILPGEVSLFLWGLLFITSSVYLGAIEPLQAEATGWVKLWKGLGLVLLIIGTLLIIGAASGGTDPTNPINLKQFSTNPNNPIQQNTAQTHFKTIKSFDDLQQQLKQSNRQNKITLLDFYADWCISCKEMEKYTFANPQVSQLMSSIHLIQADVTKNDKIDIQLQKKLSVIGPPSLLFFDGEGEELKQYRIVGFMPAEAFKQHLQRVMQALK
jgi:thiol:disulfide interchange protein DsbD